MFPDSLTFSVDAVYAVQAFCGVPSILDECYIEPFFADSSTLRSIYHGNRPTPQSKHLWYLLWKATLSFLTYRPKDQASFQTYATTGLNYSVPSFPGERQSKWQKGKCVCGCVKYTSADTVGICRKSLSLPFTYTLAHHIPPHPPLSPSSSVALSIFPPLIDCVRFSCKI